MTHNIAAWLTDMDGVLVHEEQALPGAAEFITALRDRGLPFQVLTNNSIFTPRDLSARLARAGIDLPEHAIWTSALATATFLADQTADQASGGTVYAIGETGLTTALYEAGFTQTTSDPDFVVLGETRRFSFEQITTAVRLILGGSRFIATNPDVTGPSAEGPIPATGAVAALISAATGHQPYFVGKPNPVMIRAALNRIDSHSESAAMIGDRMDTDVLAGMEAGLRTFLVLTGSTKREQIAAHPYRPTEVHEGIGDLVPYVLASEPALSAD
ncbi:HAD-IIA family hydrolase [Serinibacter salmoneus]|uniref:NagD protein n=1 Tax=Serinibacter salmoneus TaxID=556530 RepID=A0A2A9D4D6_9MICO|nr:HAD-IIA family hydrolase [Serinibacter salmoneus]PFG20822.1 NagD protein [Serinibacter salmoneus]